jgi:hypothetical protein
MTENEQLLNELKEKVKQFQKRIDSLKLNLEKLANPTLVWHFANFDRSFLEVAVLFGFGLVLGAIIRPLVVIYRKNS